MSYEFAEGYKIRSAWLAAPQPYFIAFSNNNQLLQSNPSIMSYEFAEGYKIRSAKLAAPQPYSIAFSNNNQ